MNSFKQLSDEELLLLHRMGSPTAGTMLIERFFGMRHYCCRRSCPEAFACLDGWTINEVFFRTYVKAMDKFEFIHRVKFITYFNHIYRHELLREMKEAADVSLRISLDAYVLENSQNQGTYVLSDLIQSGDILDDPAAFFEYAETLSNMGRLPKTISPLTLDLIRDYRQGYTLGEIAARHRLKKGQIRYLLRKYRMWMAKTLSNIYRKDPEAFAEQEKILDRFLGLDTIEE